MNFRIHKENYFVDVFIIQLNEDMTKDMMARNKNRFVYDILQDGRNCLLLACLKCHEAIQRKEVEYFGFSHQVA